MKRRQKKKQIPENTDYCYKVTGQSKDGMTLNVQHCPFYRTLRYEADVLVDAKGIEHPCKTPIHYCSYAKVSSEEDVLLSERVKTCGERLSFL